MNALVLIFSIALLAETPEPSSAELLVSAESAYFEAKASYETYLVHRADFESKSGGIVPNDIQLQGARLWSDMEMKRMLWQQARRPIPKFNCNMGETEDSQEG